MPPEVQRKGCRSCRKEGREKNFTLHREITIWEDPFGSLIPPGPRNGGRRVRTGRAGRRVGKQKKVLDMEPLLGPMKSNLNFSPVGRDTLSFPSGMVRKGVSDYYFKRRKEGKSAEKKEALYVRTMELVGEESRFFLVS